MKVSMSKKNGTFCISHLCSRNEIALKIHYYFIQIAHVIRQLLDNGSIMLREMKFKTKKEVSTHLLTSLTSNTLNLDEVENNFQLRFIIYIITQKFFEITIFLNFF